MPVDIKRTARAIVEDAKKACRDRREEATEAIYNLCEGCRKNKDGMDCSPDENTCLRHQEWIKIDQTALILATALNALSNL